MAALIAAEVDYAEPTEKHCPRCGQTKPISEWSKNKARAGRHGGYASYCKACVREYGKLRGYDKQRWANNREHEAERHRQYMQEDRELKLKKYRENAAAYRKANPDRVNATNVARAKHNYVPAWADKKAMRLMYKKAKELSSAFGVVFQVDHVVPLRGKLVCGLHCEANLQLLEKSINHQKRHFVWPDMP